MRRALFSFILAVSTVVPAFAQDAPPRCGGLLCDLGMFGGPGSEKTSLPCNDFLCRAVGGSPKVDGAPVAVVPAPMAVAEPKKATRKHHVKVAKTASDSAASVPDKK